MNDDLDPNAAPPTPIETTDPGPNIKRGWVRALLYVPVWGVSLIVAGVAAVLIYGVSPNDDSLGLSGTSTDLVIHGPQLLLTLLITYLFMKFVNCRPFRLIGFQWDRYFRRDLVIGMALGVGLIGSVFAILLVTGNIVVVDIQAPGTGFAYAAAVMIMVGIGEELVMRGYIQGNLMASMNKYVALLVTSALFGASHLLNPNASVLGTVNIVLAGFLLGIYYVHRQNLWLPIGMHFTWNLFQGSVFGSHVSGVTVESIFSFDTVGSDLLTGGSFGFEASLVTTVVIVAATVALHLIYRPCRTGARSQDARAV